MRYRLGWFCCWFAATVGYAADMLWVNLGEEDVGEGLTALNLVEGDGWTEPARLDGRECRRTKPEERSTFVYVDVEDSFRPPEELYVTVEFFDQHGMLSLQFDAGEGISAYRPAPESYPQTGTKRWLARTFTLRGARFRNRENGGADFRIHADGPLAVSRIVLSPVAPEGFEPPPDPAAFFRDRPPVRIAEGMTVVQQWQVHRPVPGDQLADSAYETAKRIGITSLQSYVGWAQLEPRRGEVTYDVYDPVVDRIRKHDLKWLPFLIAGPFIATPEWFRAESGVDAVCLEHGESTPIQSIWNPNLRDGVRRFLQIFRDHYEPGVIEALNLGISGNWGESIMVAGGGFDMKGRHSHLGWWCGDEYARRDWRRWCRERYGSLADLNAAWSTSFEDWSRIEPFPPARAPSRRAAADLFRWYTESMTDYAEFWVRTARELYPDTPIYLCTGGHGQPELGADFGAQARMCARYDAGIRITNQSDDAPGDFAVTRMVSSAARLYGGYYTTEPGGANTPKGVAARIFDAVSGGARGVYFKTLVNPPDRPSPTAVRFAEFAEYLVPNEPALGVAALMPNSSLVLTPGTMETMIQRTQVLRDAFDFEFIDENMIGDGLLSRFRALLFPAGNTVERPALEAIGAWVRNGGVLFVPEGSAPPVDVENRPAAWWPDRFPPAHPAGYRAARLDAGHVVVLGGEWPAWRNSLVILLLGSAGEVPWRGPLADPIDGVFDGVLAARVGKRIDYYNNRDEIVRKKLPGGGTIEVPPRSIVSIDRTQ